jgi:hypothetical protein
MDRFVKKDFSDLIEFLKDKKFVDDKNILKNIEKLKRLHKIALAIAIWDEALSSQDENRRIFVQEMRSDIVQAIPLILMGYKNAASLSIRRCIENLLRHVFFFDHPIEYKRYNDAEYLITFKQLLDYLKFNPLLEKAYLRTEIPSQLGAKYSELSILVHSNLINDKGIVDCLSLIEFDLPFFKKAYDSLNLIGRDIIFTLCFFHSDIYRSYSFPQRAFLLSILNSKSKKIFQNLLGSI